MAEAGSGLIRFEVGGLNDRTLAAVLPFVARHPPFVAYSFGVMVPALMAQLRHGANMLAIGQGRLVGYAGWLRVDEEQARQWQRHERELPEPDWQHGGAAIVTVTVADNRALLAPLLHAISHVCSGIPVYRMRSFQDGRPEMRRPPIVGRKYQFL
jgi:hypothetical protein